MEKDFKILQDLYNKLNNLSTEYELDTFRKWKSTTGKDFICCKFVKKPKQVMKIIKV